MEMASNLIGIVTFGTFLKVGLVMRGKGEVVVGTSIKFVTVLGTARVELRHFYVDVRVGDRVVGVVGVDTGRDWAQGVQIVVD